MATKKSSNPFLDFDMTKVMADFDPTKIMGEFTKTLGDFKMPGFDANSIMEAQRKNVEAMTAANKLALEGVQAVVKRQAEIMQQAMDELTSVAQELAGAKDPQATAVKQVELAKGAFEKALSNARELAEMMAKSNTEAADAINKRFGESMEELKQQIAKLKA